MSCNLSNLQPTIFGGRLLLCQNVHVLLSSHTTCCSCLCRFSERCALQWERVEAYRREGGECSGSPVLDDSFLGYRSHFFSSSAGHSLTTWNAISNLMTNMEHSRSMWAGDRRFTPRVRYYPALVTKNSTWVVSLIPASGIFHIIMGIISRFKVALIRVAPVDTSSLDFNFITIALVVTLMVDTDQRQIGNVIQLVHKTTLVIVVEFGGTVFTQLATSVAMKNQLNIWTSQRN